ncbi:hypothetical protein KP509_13G096100 [Ceratopteris richardii]|uniref:F-box domain-containing protein n=1 Tax=Ceratopteris richardii TaxID=49495 RepID=A0A8T2TNP0_CERRI|nr:hypothetical protein KP509_13G096100 [Ceratopteris richardii]
MVNLVEPSAPLRIAAGSPSPADPAMITDPWNSLPSDLQELVLAHLPVSEHSRLRSVSRSWFSSLISPQFRDLHRRLNPRARPSLFLYNHAAKISAGIWEVAEDGGAGLTPPTWRDLRIPTAYVREWTGAGAIVCLRSHLTGSAYSVGSPFSEQWTVLPSPPQTSILSKLWAVVPRSSTGAYSVLVLQLNCPSVQLDVYESEKNQWVRREIPKGSGKASLVSFSSTAAHVGGLVYSIQMESRSIVTYDPHRDVWKTLKAGLPQNLVFQDARGGGLIQMMPQVIQGCKGKLILVGAAVCSSTCASSRLCSGSAGEVGSVDGIILDDERGDVIDYAIVWELEWASGEWKELSRAPGHMCIRMLEEAIESRKATVTPVKYSGHAETVTVMATGAQCALKFDMIQETWSWMDLPPAVNCDLCLCLETKPV